MSVWEKKHKDKSMSTIQRLTKETFILSENTLNKKNIGGGWGKSMKEYHTLWRIFGWCNHYILHFPSVFYFGLWFFYPKEKISWGDFKLHFSWINKQKIVPIQLYPVIFLIWQRKEKYHFQKKWNFLAKLMKILEYTYIYGK